MKIKPDIAALDKGIVSDDTLSNDAQLNCKSNVTQTGINLESQLKQKSFFYTVEKKEHLDFLLSKETFGQFENDDDYLFALSLLFESTKETIHRKYFLNKMCSERIRNGSNVIDVGVGTGEITSYFCSKLKSITLVDINKSALNQVRLKELFPQLEIRKIADSILNVELENTIMMLQLFPMFYIT